VRPLTKKISQHQRKGEKGFIFILKKSKKGRDAKRQADKGGRLEKKARKEGITRFASKKNSPNNRQAGGRGKGGEEGSFQRTMTNRLFPTAV